MRREAYHSKKSEQTAWQYAYDHDTLVAELMRISGSDAIIVLAKEIWYYIDNLTNRNWPSSLSEGYFLSEGYEGVIEND